MTTPSTYPMPPTPESTFDVGAITAGTEVARNFESVFRGCPCPWRTFLRLDNSGGTVTKIMRVNGKTRYCRAGAVLTVTSKEVGLIYAYTVDASANEAAGLTYVYEDGGITRAD